MPKLAFEPSDRGFGVISAEPFFFCSEIFAAADKKENATSARLRERCFPGQPITGVDTNG